MAGLSRQQLNAVAWLRWRLFISAFRRKGATGEIIARIILYPVLTCLALLPAVGAGFAGYFAVEREMMALLPIPLWVIFFLWQFIGLSASTTPPSFDLNTLTRFPIVFRDYLVVRLSFGLLDLPSLIGGLSLIGLTIGIGIADPALMPWVAVVLFLYGACIIFFSRMIYSWLDRWLAQRRTREIVGAFFLFVSVGFQLINPLIRYFVRHGRTALLSPAMQQFWHRASAAGSILPPGLAALAIALMHRSRVLPALGTMVAVGLYAGLFLYVLSVRVRAQYLGEDLSEAPAASSVKQRRIATAEPTRPSRRLLPPVPGACFRKELIYLRRSGPLLYSFIMPVFMVFIISTNVLHSAHTGPAGRHVFPQASSLAFFYGCGYLQLFITALLYNCFGMDGAGMQFYFFAPVRIRDVVLGKNMMSTLVLAVETALIYGAVCLAAGRPTPEIAGLTVSWVLFTFLIGLTFGNMRSLYAPKKVAEGGARTMKMSGLSSLISFGILLVPFAMAVGALLACHFWGHGGASAYWIAAAVFLALAAGAGVGYIIVLGRLDAIAAGVRQDMAAELCKT